MFSKDPARYDRSSKGKVIQKSPPDYSKPAEELGAQKEESQKSDRFYVDVHCHSTFQAFNRTNKKTANEIWPKSSSKKEIDTDRFKDTPLIYQSDFTTIAKSRVRVVFDALLPLEQGFVWKKGKALALGLASLFMKLSPWRIIQVQRFEHNYFEDLEMEYNLISKKEFQKCLQEVRIENGLPADTQIKVVSNYKELKVTLQSEVNTIAIILTIEGGHALGSGSEQWLNIIENDELYAPPVTGYDPISTFDLEDEDGSFASPSLECAMVKRFRSKRVQELTLMLLQNIKTIKTWNEGNYAPFFLTFSHHFWNQLCGHAVSLPYYKKEIKILNQDEGIGWEMSEVGKVVLCALLSKKNGKRILIDTKHMSIKGKNWYYNCINEYNKDKKNFEKIPIISSHAGVSGHENMKDLFDLNEPEKIAKEANDLYENSENRFNVWDINLSDEEILIIYKSNGLIGLNFDERILAGKKWRDKFCTKYWEISDHKGKAPCMSKSNWAGEYAPKIMQWDNFNYEWAAIIAEQLYHIAKVIAEAESISGNETWNGDKDQKAKKPWRTVAIGTDWDGAINPLDAYCLAPDLDKLEVALIANFKDMRDWETRKEKLKDSISAPFRLQSYPLLQALTDENIQQIVLWFMQENAMAFLETYFTDEYRCQAITSP